MCPDNMKCIPIPGDPSVTGYSTFEHLGKDLHLTSDTACYWSIVVVYCSFLRNICMLSVLGKVFVKDLTLIAASKYNNFLILGGCFKILFSFMVL